MMGLSSGLDTESIIQATLRMHQFKIDNQMRNRKMIEWRQQTHNGIKDQITSFRNTFLSNLGSKNMLNRNVFNATTASVSGKNSSAVSISTTTGTPIGTMRIGQVVSLAKGASLTSGGSVSSNGAGFNPNSRLDSLSFLGGNKIEFENYQATVNVGGTNVKVNRDDVPENGDVSWGEWINTAKMTDGTEVTLRRNSDNTYSYKINDGAFNALTFNGEGKAIIEYGDDKTLEFTQNAAGKLVLGKNEVGFYKEQTVLADDNATEVKLRQHENGALESNGKAVEFIGTTSITVNDKVVTINSNDTITSMINKVNSSGAGVTMSYNRLTDRFSIESNTIGAASTVNVSGETNILEMLSGPGAVAEAGSTAKVYINGELVERNTNSFAYRGLNITLNHTTDTGATSPTNHEDDTIVTFKRDATKAMDAIRDFINGYNAIISKLEGLLNDRKTGNEVSYKPLTDEEKSAMSDKQIEEWEAIAKKGILRNDQGIQSLVNSLRSSFFSTIEGTGMSAAQIGLTTGNFFGGTGGQIIIDEERLRAALESDPDKVADIFTGPEGNRGAGLVWKMNETLGTYLNTSQTNTIKNLEESMKRANEQISKMEQRMWAEEDKLYRQFAAMETAMSKLQSQGDWFSAMLGGK